ncbi:MAG: hypothetical protein J6V15_01720, partial [Clostridia bacterium]|nr:hypothetical protein [Clostridia bacterium]
RPIRCIETGLVYPSVVSAAEALGVHRSGLYKCALGELDTCAGYHWEYVGDGHMIRPGKPKKPDKPRSAPSMTIYEVQEEAARRTRETGRRVRYAHIQIEETVALIRQRDTAAAAKLEKLKRRAKLKKDGKGEGE